MSMSTSIHRSSNHEIRKSSSGSGWAHISGSRPGLFNNLMCDVRTIISTRRTFSDASRRCIMQCVRAIRLLSDRIGVTIDVLSWRTCGGLHIRLRIVARLPYTIIAHNHQIGRKTSRTRNMQYSQIILTINPRTAR